MTQNPKKPKKVAEMTSEEAIRHLFHPKVVEHAKRHVKEAENRSAKPDPKSMSGE